MENPFLNLLHSVMYYTLIYYTALDSWYHEILYMVPGTLVVATSRTEHCPGRIDC